MKRQSSIGTEGQRGKKGKRKKEKDKNKNGFRGSWFGYRREEIGDRI
jgi:hypothetical protein